MTEWWTHCNYRSYLHKPGACDTRDPFYCRSFRCGPLWIHWHAYPGWVIHLRSVRLFAWRIPLLPYWEI